MSPELSDHTSYSENSVFFFFYCSHDVKFSKTASPNSLKIHVAVPLHEYTFSTLSNFCFHAYLFIAVLTSHLLKLVTCCFPMSRLSSLSSVSLRLCKHSFFIVFSIYFNCIVMILFCKCHFVSVLIKTSSISAFLDHSPPWKLLWNYIFLHQLSSSNVTECPELWRGRHYISVQLFSLYITKYYWKSNKKGKMFAVIPKQILKSTAPHQLNGCVHSFDLSIL